MSTYTPISSFTATTSISSVTIAGIPQNYTDLVLVGVNGNAVNSDNDIYIRFNSDSGSNYSRTQMVGNGSNASSSRTSNNTEIRIGPSYNNTPTSTLISHIMNYSNTTTYKTVLSRTGHASGYVMGHVALWRSTAAITSITLTLQNSESFVTGSTFNLYGIDAQASAQAKATGGSSIYTDGSYWYHIFNSSGTFTPTENLSNVNYLVVAGGGGGGNNFGGGGGAGGLRCTVTATGGGGSLESALSLTAQAYTVTVGAGGAAEVSGNNSVFSSITSTGGGRGGGANGGSPAAATGGSGGGLNGFGQSANIKTGTANQGFAGGWSGVNPATDTAGGGGGGGAGAVGGNGSSGSNGGNGGAGVATSITGSSVTYAGGGGGGGGSQNQAFNEGAGGAGGGGAGSNGNISGTATATAGTANTGGGGGAGGYYGNSGAAGGSGIVIIRYAV